MTFMLIAVGGAAGAVARWVVSGWVQNLSGGFFPWGTLAVNVVGSVALGFTLAWVQSTLSSPEVRELAAVGFLGSFTTFSTFSYETLAMLRDGEWWRAGGYTAGSVVLGVLAVGAGWGLALALIQAGRS